MKKWIVIFLFVVSLQGIAQDKIGITTDDYQNTSVEMADVMRSEGKIYVLVGIIGIVLGGIFPAFFVVPLGNAKKYYYL